MNDNYPTIAFLGGLFPKDDDQIISQNTIGQPQNAANLLQWNIINGIEKNTNSPVTILNSLFIGSFPKRYKKLFIKSYSFNHYNSEQHCDYNIGFLNAPQIKQVSRLIHVKQFLNHHKQSYNCEMIIGYSMTLTIVMGLLHAKRLNPNIITCLVIPDLPEYMNLGKKKGLLFSLTKKLNSKKLYKAIQEIDCFVILTEYMADALNITHKPYTVIEGIAKQRDNRCVYTLSKKKFVYTGSLGEKYGVKELVDAFHRLKEKNIELIICGGGDTVEYIKNLSNVDERIIYKGVLTPDEVYQIQEDAYVLVNPRNSKEEYTKYSFPSKTLEYLASGHPVLMYHLPGIPKEYDKYIIYFDDSDDAIYKGLKKIISMDPDEIKKRGIIGKKFVEDNKNDIKQTKKILDMYLDIERK